MKNKYSFKHPCKNCISFVICRNQVKNSEYPFDELRSRCELLNKYIKIDEMDSRNYKLKKLKTFKLFDFVLDTVPVTFEHLCRDKNKLNKYKSLNIKSLNIKRSEIRWKNLK